jgi:moderate conductance mechanosensitive channel
MMWDRIFTAEYWTQEWRLIATRAGEAAVGILWALLLLGVGRLLMLKAIDAALRPVASRKDHRTPEARLSRTQTLAGLLKSIANYTLVFVAGVMILEKFGLNIAALLTGAGVAGLAVGFGAQRLVRDVISGFFILLEDQFSVGDTITAVGSTGTVVEMGMRITRLRDDTGKLIILSNGDITTVINQSRGPILAAVEIGVAPPTDLNRVRELVEETGPKLLAREGLLAEAPIVKGVTALDGTKMTIRVTAQALPGHQQDAEMALRATLLEAFTAARIKIV